RGLVILPVGVVEEHGAHLPLGLDSFAAEVYAEAAAPHLEEKGYEIVIAPTISYGVARAAIDFPGTLSLEPETLRSLVVDIGGYLARPGRGRVGVFQRPPGLGPNKKRGGGPAAPQLTKKVFGPPCRMSCALRF